MSTLPTDWGALCLLVFLLGMRHGLDADHLAAIDGLTRLCTRQRQAAARSCGVWFSLGHGLVVLPVAALAGTLGAQWAPPAWFDLLGSLISIGLLATLGGVNLWAVLRTAPDQPVALVGLRGRLVDRLLQRFGQRRSATGVMGVGFLFALSFDTLSQSALFAVMAVQFGGLQQALTLGALFVLGMLASDGANGWWMSFLIGRTDRLAAMASRVLTTTVAAVSLLVAGLGAATLWSSRVEGWTGEHELGIGLSVIALIALGYGAACALSARRRKIA